jgi:hypothetical protein
MKQTRIVLALLATVSACGSPGTGSPPPGPPTTEAIKLGEKHAGVYHLGPVDFAETDWHNACAPAGGYRPDLRSTVGLDGEYIAGVSNELSLSGGLCDACILIETETGHSIVARLVTYGVENAPGDIDVSPSVFAEIHENEYPRTMTWSLAKCPDAGNIVLEFQTASNPWWTSLWVRNARLPLKSVEVKSTDDADFVPLERASDGTLTDATGFGYGAFTLRITASDGQVLLKELPDFTAGGIVDTGLQFD